MSISKTLSTILVTAAIGTLSVIFAIPKKNNINENDNSTKAPEVEERENLFI